MSYAYGKYALAICDRCGQRYPYLTLKEEWQGQMVCPSCWEAKHPQLGPFIAPVDPQSLYKARPEAPMALEVPVGENVVFPPWRNGSLHAVGIVGTVRVTINGVG